VSHVAIIGGGFAGLAAGVELAASGRRVTVLESRPRLGGRAYSFEDEATGETVDNGQHAMMGCYRHTLAFLEQIGATQKLARQRNLYVELVHPQRGVGVIAGAPLPSPLHAVAGILRYRLLSRGERASAVYAGLRLMVMRRLGDARLRDWTVERVLIALGQSDNARRSFWYPIAIATLNESPARAAAAPFIEVLARAFFGARADSQFVLPRVGLSELYTSDARRFIEARGGCVRLKATVTDLVLAGERLVGLMLRDGTTIDADGCISTVPPKALAPLLPDVLRADERLHRLGEIEVSPIVSVHLWVDRPVLAGQFVGLLDTTTQWLFNRTQLTASGNGNGRLCLSAVISAGRDVIEWETSRVVDTVTADIRARIPAARAARVIRSVVVKEKLATISPTPAAERVRPGAETPVRNFFLAGDWTRTGLPPTIESAVVSGRRAAALLVEDLRSASFRRDRSPLGRCAAPSSRRC
jgi:hydroxysqualene dehydroxylase